jgi:hypothetical protein
VNAVQISISRAIREIPRMLLEDAFLKREYPYRQSPKTIEQCIKEEVIYKIVLPDLNLENGVYSFIPLNNAQVIQSDYDAQIYYIPKEVTGGRAILTAITVGTASPYMEQGFAANCGNSMINRKIHQLVSSISDLQVTTNSRVELIAENTVLVRDIGTQWLGGMYLVCILEMDDQLSNIRPRSIPFFTQLITLAIKGYMYTELIINVDKGRIYAGADLGIYREILMEYRDAWATYYDLLREKAGKILYMNNGENMNRHLRYLISGSRGR